ncbi:Ni/Fe hydrogenase subunit alpha [Hydrogenivirga sp. 128-5-R1-1]|uniref:Ni/Fe hydrogenase subunit alpha n=1 Tax=Hydrogenivirga sp. 128-5-R1-1 TaxID=392423 RepID=UPI00015EF866|nr:Ni/Fe hydrogenase subunit alpha [Hydrogenivirga sp. 128-5-R1-1]EDP75597.1 nickel-dependent hydrogenase, large subunit [Hydrogenivirga sp. 128-5-R1-1]
MSEVRIDPLTRVEGLGRLSVLTEGEEVKDVRLEIFEPPRFFERLLKGKKPDQVIDTVARICGLCPVAYQLTAVEAFESIFELKVPRHIRELRRAIYCGEWVSSHSAHIFFLHLPDFYERESFLELMREKRELLEAGLQIRKTGNSIIELLGGRHIHPVNIRVGGFYKIPSAPRIENTLAEIESALPFAEKALELFLNFDYPEMEKERIFVSLGNHEVYPITEGSAVSSEGMNIEKNEYEEYFVEYQLPHSTALYSRLKDGKAYEVGALARIYNNFGKLPQDLREKVEGVLPARNPFKSIIARIVEVIYALREAKHILEKFEGGEPHVEYSIREGEGVGITEAPRGILYHRYRVNSKGEVVFANIVPPTSQNQRAMEEDVLLGLKTLKNGDIRVLAEKLVRNFDPCISCASHFLEVIRVP